MTALTFLLVALVGLCLAFALLWAVCRWVDNFGFVDAAWALAFGAVAAFSIGAGLLFWVFSRPVKAMQAGVK